VIEKYRKKPVVVEALQWTEMEDTKAVRAFCGESLLGVSQYPNEEPYLIVGTLENPHIASSGDYIIKGVAGEFYPCKPDIFIATYEKVIE